MTSRAWHRQLRFALVALMVCGAAVMAVLTGCGQNSSVPGLVNRTLTLLVTAYSGTASPTVSLRPLVVQSSPPRIVLEYGGGDDKRRVVLERLSLDNLDDKGILHFAVLINEAMRRVGTQTFTIAIENDFGTILRGIYTHAGNVDAEINPRVEVLLNALSTAKALVFDESVTRGQTFDYPTFEQLVVTGGGELYGLDLKTLVNLVTSTLLGDMRSGRLSADSQYDVKTQMQVRVFTPIRTASETGTASATSTIASTTDYVGQSTTTFGTPTSSTGGGGSSAVAVTSLGIMGRIVNASAVGIGGAQVWLEAAPQVVTTTAADGSFVLNGLPAGMYRVVARAVVGATTMTNRSAVVPAGAVTQLPDLQLLPASPTVAIRVNDSTQAPIVNARISWWGESVNTDASGACNLPPMPIGATGEIQCTATGFTPCTLSWLASATYRQDLSITLSRTSELNAGPSVQLSHDTTLAPTRRIIRLFAQGADADGTPLTYRWLGATAGTLASGTGPSDVTWTAPAGAFTSTFVAVEVTDPAGWRASSDILITDY